MPDPLKCPMLLTGEQFLAALQAWGQVPRLIEDTDDLMGTEGPRISTTGMVPHPSPDGEIHAWVWPDGLCIVSRAIFDALKG